MTERRRARVLATGPTPPPYNGMSVATSFLLRSRAARDLGIQLVDTADRRGLGNVGKFDFGNVIAAFGAGARFLRALVVSRPDVVYVPVAQNTLGFIRDAQFLLLARLARKRIVIHVHGGHFGRFYASSQPLMRLLIRACVAGSHSVAVLGECLRSMFDDLVAMDRVRVIPNGIDDFGLERLACERRVDRIVWLSKLDPTKGYVDMLHTVPQVARSFPDVEYVFAGEWLSEVDRVTAEDYLAEHGVTARVRFLGPLGTPEKYDLLASSGVFCLPTRYRFEGQPYSILEAMSCALPVISSPAGCIAETVVDGVTGYLIPAGDIDALADRIIRLLTEPARAVAMGKAGRERFLAEYTYARWDERVSSMLEDAVLGVEPSGRSIV